MKPWPATHASRASPETFRQTATLPHLPPSHLDWPSLPKASPRDCMRTHSGDDGAVSPSQCPKDKYSGLCNTKGMCSKYPRMPESSILPNHIHIKDLFPCSYISKISISSLPQRKPFPASLGHTRIAIRHPHSGASPKQCRVT